MVKLHFKDPSEFNSLFKSKTEKVTDAIVLGIEKAILDKRKTADLFEITFYECEEAYIISLPRTQWNTAISSCLDFYHKNNCNPDKSIDTWKISEILKTYE